MRLFRRIRYVRACTRVCHSQPSLSRRVSSLCPYKNPAPAETATLLQHTAKFSTNVADMLKMLEVDESDLGMYGSELDTETDTILEMRRTHIRYFKMMWNSPNSPIHNDKVKMQLRSYDQNFQTLSLRGPSLETETAVTNIRELIRSAVYVSVRIPESLLADGSSFHKYWGKYRQEIEFFLPSEEDPYLTLIGQPDPLNHRLLYFYRILRVNYPEQFKEVAPLIVFRFERVEGFNEDVLEKFLTETFPEVKIEIDKSRFDLNCVEFHVYGDVDNLIKVNSRLECCIFFNEKFENVLGMADLLQYHRHISKEVQLVRFGKNGVQFRGPSKLVQKAKSIMSQKLEDADGHRYQEITPKVEIQCDGNVIRYLKEYLRSEQVLGQVTTDPSSKKLTKIRVLCTSSKRLEIEESLQSYLEATSDMKSGRSTKFIKDTNTNSELRRTRTQNDDPDLSNRTESDQASRNNQRPKLEKEGTLLSNTPTQALEPHLVSSEMRVRLPESTLPYLLQIALNVATPGSRPQLRDPLQFLQSSVFPSIRLTLDQSSDPPELVLHGTDSEIAHARDVLVGAVDKVKVSKVREYSENVEDLKKFILRSDEWSDITKEANDNTFVSLRTEESPEDSLTLDSLTLDSLTLDYYGQDLDKIESCKAKLKDVISRFHFKRVSLPIYRTETGFVLRRLANTLAQRYVRAQLQHRDQLQYSIKDGVIHLSGEEHHVTNCYDVIRQCQDSISSWNMEITDEKKHLFLCELIRQQYFVRLYPTSYTDYNNDTRSFSVLGPETDIANIRRVFDDMKIETYESLYHKKYNIMMATFLKRLSPFATGVLINFDVNNRSVKLIGDEENIKVLRSSIDFITGKVKEESSCFRTSLCDRTFNLPLNTVTLLGTRTRNVKDKFPDLSWYLEEGVLKHTGSDHSALLALQAILKNYEKIEEPESLLTKVEELIQEQIK